MKIGEFSERIKGLLAFLGLLVLLGGLGVLGYQAWAWLRTGKWPSYTGYGPFVRWTQAGFIPRSWVYEPHSWYGLHKITILLLKTVPLSLWLFVLGGLLFAVFISLMDSKRWKE